MPARPARRRPRPVLVLLAAGALVPLSGCLERRIRVTSEPPGAIVWLNDREIGRTPVETPFTFYGTYDVRLELDGFEPVQAPRKASAPVYEWPGFDLLAEMWPGRIRTDIDWHFDLEPALERSLEPAVVERDLIERAAEMRARTAPPGD